MSTPESDKKLKALKLARIVQPIAVPIFVYVVFKYADLFDAKIAAAFAVVIGVMDFALLHWLVKSVENKNKTIG